MEARLAKVTATRIEGTARSADLNGEENGFASFIGCFVRQVGS